MQLAGSELTRFKAKFADLLSLRPSSETRQAQASTSAKSGKKA